MKALDDRMQDPRAQNAADLAARVAAFFEEYPMLCGFSVQRRSTLSRERAVAPLKGELCLADVSVSTWPGFRMTLEFYGELVSALLELMEERAEAADFLSGRTFARALH
jgi:hypothetical protein